MPHPERACARTGARLGEPLMGGEDGLAVWQSLLEWAAVRA
jgi:phosphoribosylformylglycinamidine (FGAM) synthase-like amidotransferase family enzyme